MSGPEKPKIKRRIMPVLPNKLPELKELTSETIQKTIKGLQRAIGESYVFPEKAEDLCKSLHDHYTKGDYDKITDPATLCEQLTQHLLDVVNDKHLKVLLPENMPNIRLQAKKEIQEGEEAESDSIKAKVLPGNIGYISIAMFNPPEIFLDRIKAAMQLVEDSNALIIDLRKCRGGRGDQVNFLLSYFFDHQAPLTLLETYFRPQNRTFKSQTTRTPFNYTKQVYVLTSGFTYSAAEKFAFALKIHKRATIVGTKTGGGAHPCALIGLETGLLFMVPIGRTYDPKTNEDFEGTGVTPDIRCPEDNALIEAMKDIHTKLIAETAD